MFKSHCVKRIHVLIVLATLWTTTLLATDLVSKLDVLLNDPSTHFNGVVLVAKGDTLLYQKAIGYSDTTHLIPLKGSDQFIIGSISKQITAVLVLRAAEEKLLQLDFPIKIYLSELQDDWSEQVTVHYLLNHTSGIQSLGMPLSCRPGEKFAYSNLGYDLLGKILERVTSKSYSQLVQELFEEVCKTYSTCSPPSGPLETLKKLYPNLAVGHVELQNAKTEMPKTDRDSEHNPSSGNISTVHDLWKWNRSLHAGKLLSDEAYSLLISPSASRVYRWGRLGYGCGIQIVDDPVFELSHCGTVAGYLSTLLYYPMQDLSVCILENRALWTDEWGVEEQKRTFHVHDAIREIMHKFMIASKEDKKYVTN